MFRDPRKRVLINCTANRDQGDIYAMLVDVLGRVRQRLENVLSAEFVLGIFEPKPHRVSLRGGNLAWWRHRSTDGQVLQRDALLLRTLTLAPSAWPRGLGVV